MPDNDPSSRSGTSAGRSPSQGAGGRDNALASTAQLMAFQPGLYSVEFAARHSTPTDMGVLLPCARFDPLPPAGPEDGRAVVTAATDGGWLSRPGDQALILVRGGLGRMILTVLRAGPTMPAPELRIAQVPLGAAPAPQPTASGPGIPLITTVHATGTGDVRADANGWAGVRGATVEGFQLQPATPGAVELEYQAIMGEDWNTPWFRTGEFCGSRGLSLALLGIRVRLTGSLAETHTCQYWGTFPGAGLRGPFRDGEACLAGREPLEAIRVVVEPRAAEAPERAPDAAAQPSFDPTTGEDAPRRPRGGRRKA